MKPQSTGRLWKNHFAKTEPRWPTRLEQAANAPQDTQKVFSPQPEQAKRRGVFCLVSGALERSKNAAGEFCQHLTRRTWRTCGFLYILVFSSIIVCFPGYNLAGQDVPKPLESVRGSGCYKFGDEETPAKARKSAMAIAQEQAVRSHHVFVESSVRVKNFQLEEDLIQTASAAMLQEIQIEKEERKAQEICITLTAKISPVSIEDMIRQRVNAKEVAEIAKTALVPKQPTFGLKVSTNKPEGRFLEGEKVVVYVQSDRDAYLKLDYFQANGTVIHLVPNVYRGQAFIEGGKKYAFGDDSSPEHFVVDAPYGTETIKAIVGIQPFETTVETKEAVSDSRTYLDEIQQSLRGIKVVAAAASVELKTESQAVSEYKKGTPQKR
jgi:hypothetical protein